MSVRCWLMVLLLLLPVAGCKREADSSQDPEAAVAGQEAVQKVVPVPEQGKAIESTSAMDVKGEGKSSDIPVAADALGVPEIPSLATISWSISPERLDVMRDTSVQLVAQWDGVDADKFRCEWEPGDRSGRIRGCRVAHLFQTGLVDRKVGLKIYFGDRAVFSEERPLPLEKLSVKELSSEPGDLPEALDTATRLLVWSQHRVPQSEDAKALRRAVEATSANLVIVFVNVSVSGKRMASFLSAAGQDGPPLAPVYCKKPTGPEVAPPDVRLLTHGDDNEVPYRFAWLFQQVLFVQLDPRVSGNSPAREKWLYGHLARGKVIPHRIVLSCRALENLTAGGGSELTPQFRYYEKLLRGDTSLFIAGGEPVFYSGIYGDLNVVSAGSAAGRSGTLQGVKDKQQSLFALVELRAEQPPAVYAINPASPDQVIDPVKFPARAGNLERRL